MTAEAFLEKECGGKAFLTPSCTSALELACMLTINAGDEVIMPSWTFPSAAAAVIRQGGIPVFVDVDRNLNIDPSRIIGAITRKTKAIMPIHYAGVVADMGAINSIAKMYGLYVIEDAAQAIGNWKVTGDLGCLSFHSTKNVECGEGGALIVNNKLFLERTEILQFCGTSRAKMKRGEADGYDWLEASSHFLMSPVTAEYLLEQLQRLPEITAERQKNWEAYSQAISGEKSTERGNGHIFWVMGRKHLEKPNTTKHYDALHNTLPGRKYGRVGGPITRAVYAAENLVKFNTCYAPTPNTL